MGHRLHSPRYLRTVRGLGESPDSTSSSTGSRSSNTAVEVPNDTPFLAALGGWLLKSGVLRVDACNGRDGRWHYETGSCKGLRRQALSVEVEQTSVSRIPGHTEWHSAITAADCRECGCEQCCASDPNSETELPYTFQDKRRLGSISLPI